MKSKYLFGLVALLLAGAFAWYQYRAPRYTAGETAPDFEVTLKDGRVAKLSDLRGKYVLLQFWGSWCGPCRAENPHLVELYKKYHEKGFEIFSIGIEQNQRAWERAIEKDAVNWPYHSADFRRFDGNVAMQYNVKSIPATFLINPDGIIMGVNFLPSQIDKTLREKL
jgi:thiol-disulfide isomerase/thioredoxin